MARSGTLQSSLLWTVATIALCAIGLSLVYWPGIISGFGVISTDVYDGKIMMAMLEHWYNVYRFKEHPLTSIYFHPFTNTLAYNDGNLISGTIYSVFRALGADPFLAYELMNWAIRVIGTVATIVFARRVLRLNMAYSLASGFIILIIANLAYRMIHAQLLFAYLVPVGFLLFTATFDSFKRAADGQDVRPAVVFALAMATLVYTWAMTAFYSLYIFGLLLALYFMFLNLVSAEVRGTTGAIIKNRPALVVLAAAGLASAALGVLHVYGKALTEGHSVESIRVFAGYPIDLVNVGTGNVWSRTLDPIFRATTGQGLAYTESTTGFTPVLLAAFLLTSVWLAFMKRAHRGREATIVLGLALACIVIGFFALKTAGRAHWEPLFVHLPGAKALRVPMRFLLFIAPIVVLVAVYGISRLPPALGAVIVTVVAVEQYRTELPFMLNRTSELAVLRSIPAPPSECRSFFVSVPRGEPTGNFPIDKFYVHGVDAMFLAEVLGLPTVNGMTTFTPDGWDLHSPFDPDYRSRVHAYAERMNIRQGLCSLDLRARTWAVE